MAGGVAGRGRVGAGAPMTPVAGGGPGARPRRCAGSGCCFASCTAASVPPGMNHDAAFNGMYALHVLQGAPYTPYISAAWGHETLFMYLCTPLVAWLGNVPDADSARGDAGRHRHAADLLPVCARLCGRRVCAHRAGVPRRVRLARGVQSGRLAHDVVALVRAASRCSVSGWALQHGEWRDWWLAGAGSALAIYTYDAGRAVPLMVGVLLAVFAVAEHRRLPARLLGAGVVLVTFLIVGAPILDVFFFMIYWLSYVLITPEDIRLLRQAYPGVPVITYVNTSAAVKAECDICCTSGNAVKVVESLGCDRVIFLPDEYLASWVATQTEVQIIKWNGHCEVHERFTGDEIRSYRKGTENLVVIAHPECPPDVLAAADFVGSTAQMIDFVRDRRPAKVLMVTECSMSDNVAAEVKDVEFVRPCNLCPHMKRITLANIHRSLQTLTPRIEIDADVAARARLAVERMLAVGR